MDFDDLRNHIEVRQQAEIDRQIKNAKDRQAKQLSRLPLVLDLMAAGFLDEVPTELPDWSRCATLIEYQAQHVHGRLDFSWCDIKIEPEQLPALHTLFGRCQLSKSPSQIHDGEKGLVRMPIVFEGERDYVPAENEVSSTTKGKYPGNIDKPVFYMVKELPTDAKCKIVEETSVKRDKYLVCNVPE